MAMTLAFTGATGTVTGSHYVLDTGRSRLLLDCGLYQGSRELQARNWERFPVPPASIDAAVLSHAHIDHTGYLPRLVADGFGGPVYATAPTRELAALLLPDSARLGAEEAEYRNRKGATRFQPARALYSEQEAEEAARRIRPWPYRAPQQIADGVAVTLRHAGHILGSAMVSVAAGGVSLLFTGDLGRQRPALLLPPDAGGETDYLLMESTYGNRRHEEGDPRAALERAVRSIADRGGVLVIPAFAVGRTQEVLYLLRDLEDAGRIPTLPVAVDSPMAIDATEILFRHSDELAPEAQRIGDRAVRPRRLSFACTVEESKALNAEQGPAIIIASSGMATGGRVLHHLRNRLPDERNGVLLVGYQAEGSRGRQLAEGAAQIRIFGEQIPVRARVMSIDALSAHADANELMAWLGTLSRPPRRTFLIHGEDDARQALAARIRQQLGWTVEAPAPGTRVTLE